MSEGADGRRHEHQAASASTIRRRDFLAWGGAAALLPAFEGIARAQALIDAEAAAAPRPMSVGYLVGSDTWSPLRNVTAGFLNRGVKADSASEPHAVEVIRASDLIAGTQELANEAIRMRVHGIYPVPNPQVQSVYLTALFSGVEAGLPSAAPFLAWGYHSRPAPDPAPPIAFTYPLGADGAVELLLEVKAARKSDLKRRPSALAASTPGGRFTTRFTVDWFAGQPKLQRGVYLLGLAGDTWTQPRTLPIVKSGQQRPLELVSLVVSFEPIAA